MAARLVSLYLCHGYLLPNAGIPSVTTACTDVSNVREGFVFFLPRVCRWHIEAISTNDAAVSDTAKVNGHPIHQIRHAGNHNSAVARRTIVRLTLASCLFGKAISHLCRRTDRKSSPDPSPGSENATLTCH